MVTLLQVLLGVTRAFLKMVKSKIPKREMELIDSAVGKLQPPNTIPRSPRRLKDLNYFKANEIEVWLLYIGPVFFQGLHDNLYLAFLKFSWAIRQLLQNDQHIDECSRLIDEFCQEMASIDQKNQTYNLHSLRHLAWQVKNFGPLWTTSAMAFESAHHILNVKFTGTVNHLGLMVERYRRSRALKTHSVPEDNLKNFTEGLLSKRKDICPAHRMKMLPLMQYFNELGSNLSARLKLGRIVYESESYELSKSTSYVKFKQAGNVCFGQILFFFVENNRNFCMLKRFEVVQFHKSASLHIELPDFLYEVVKESSTSAVSVEKVVSPVFLVGFKSKTYFVELSDHFDHN